MRSAFPVDAVKFRASGQAPAPGSGHRLRGQSLALLVTAALQDEAPGLRLHPLAEAMGASPLALLGLIRALHAVGECSPRPIPRISALVAYEQPVQSRRSAKAVVCSRFLVDAGPLDAPKTGPTRLARRPSDHMGPHARTDA